MNTSVNEYVEQFMADIVAKNPNEPEFHQAVREVVESVAPYIMENPQLVKMKVLERIAEIGGGTLEELMGGDLVKTVRVVDARKQKKA